jgi:uncharacterized protein YndB with AHSA1/START domain
MKTFSVLDVSPDDATLVLTAHYPASPERVFAAWLDPILLADWMKPSPECQLNVLRFEPMVGGQFAAQMHLEEGVFGYSGSFTVIDPPHRLEMTWLWDPTEENPYPETHLAVNLEPEEGGTRLTLTHSRLRSLESRDAHSEGWTGSLSVLAAQFGAQ